jgi:hypothetical protein
MIGAPFSDIARIPFTTTSATFRVSPVLMSPAAGHDHTPIIMKASNLDLSFTTGGKHLSVYEKVFADKRPTYFEHEIAA